MSISRWTKYSQVYVYYAEQGAVCYDCTLPDVEHDPRVGGFVSPTLTGMMAHLRRHLEAGHKVPKYVFRRLLADLIANGDDV